MKLLVMNLSKTKQTQKLNFVFLLLFHVDSELLDMGFVLVVLENLGCILGV